MTGNKSEYRKGKRVLTAEIQGDNIYIEEYIEGYLVWNNHIPIKLIKKVLENN